MSNYVNLSYVAKFREINTLAKDVENHLKKYGVDFDEFEAEFCLDRTEVSGALDFYFALSIAGFLKENESTIFERAFSWDDSYRGYGFWAKISADWQKMFN